MFEVHVLEIIWKQAAEFLHPIRHDREHGTIFTVRWDKF